MNPSGRGSSESDTLLPRHNPGDGRPIMGTGYATGHRAENACGGPTDSLDECPEHPIVPKIWSFGGLMDIATVVILGMIGNHMRHKTAYYHDIIHPDDPAINYPYVKHDAYPSHKWNRSILLMIPISALVLIRLLEVVYPMLLHIPALQRILPHPHYSLDHCPYMDQRRTGRTIVASAGSVAKGIGAQIYRDIFAIAANAALLYAVVETLKVWTGSLRPDFMERCDWDSDHKRCTGDEHLIMEGMKGFPSGHAAYSFGSMLFLVQILFHTFRPQLHSFMATTLCLAPLSWAGRVTMTRYWEHRHTPMALLTGAVIGLIISVITYRVFRAKANVRHHRLCCAGNSPTCSS